MKRFLYALVVMVMAATPGTALAQPPRTPTVESGAQVSKKIDDPAPVTWSPRLTLNLTHLTAIEGTVDIQKPFEPEFEGGARTSARGFGAHWRQALFNQRYRHWRPHRRHGGRNHSKAADTVRGKHDPRDARDDANHKSDRRHDQLALAAWL